MADGILNPIEQLEADLDFEVYTKQEVDALLDEKADKSDTYTKTETDTLLNGKADADSVYTKTEINTKIPNTVGSATKPTYVNGGVLTECTYELNKTVPANAVFTDTTYSAGNGLNLSGTSFSAKAGTNVTVDGNGINVNGSGVVTSADSGLINGGTAYTELRPTLDGTWVKNAQTTATNLQKLEGGIEYLYGLLSHQYDQLKKYINGNYYDYDTDTNSAYTKTVLAGAMPYASLDSVGGRTLVFNQICNNGNFVIDTGWNHSSANISVTDNVCTTTLVAKSSATQISRTESSCPTVIGHKYYASCEVNPAKATTCRFQYSSVATGISNVDIPANAWTRVANLYTCTNNVGTLLYYNVGTTLDIGDTVQFRNYMLFDLTLMFGAGNEPTTYAEFQQMFPASYYPYNAGTLLSAGVTEVKSVGINVWDEQWEVGGVNVTTGIKDGATNRIRSKNFIPVQSGVSYYFNGLSLSENMVVLCYTYDKTYTGTYYYRNVNQSIQTLPQGTAFILFCMVAAYGTTYRNDICIHVSSASTNGKYYPYQENTYPIPAEIQALEGYGWSAGSVYNYVDFERKVFVQRVASYTFDGTETWTYYPQGDKNTFNSGNRFLTDVKKFGNGIMVEYTKSDAQYIASQDNLTFQFFNTPYISIRNDAYTDATTFASYMSGKTIYYELDTPIETDISAYLTDDNLISVESGGTLTFPNSNGTDYQIPVPSAETYMVDLQASL